MDKTASAEKAAHWVTKAGAEGVQLLVFPEVFLPGFPYWINCYAPLIQADVNTRYQRESVTIDGPEIQLIADACREANVSIVIGISERRVEGHTCHNSAFLSRRRDGVVGVHRKLQPTYAERYIWGQGDGSTLIAPLTPAGRVSALCCWEHTMNLARQAVIEQQPDIHAALWPSLSTMAGFDAVANIQIEAMMRNHALTGGCFVFRRRARSRKRCCNFSMTHWGRRNCYLPVAAGVPSFTPFPGTSCRRSLARMSSW